MTQWHKYKYFTKGEKNIYSQPAWGDPDKICHFTLYMLDIITGRIKEYVWREHQKMAYCLIHCAYQDREKGYHPLGTAVDYHFSPIELITPYKAFEITEQVLNEYSTSNFMGLGVYPDWANPGFHLDTRLPNDNTPDRWAGFHNKKTKTNRYVGINEGLEQFRSRYGY
jgi:hypothetical protein